MVQHLLRLLCTGFTVERHYPRRTSLLVEEHYTTSRHNDLKIRCDISDSANILVLQIKMWQEFYNTRSTEAYFTKILLLRSWDTDDLRSLNYNMTVDTVGWWKKHHYRGWRSTWNSAASSSLHEYRFLPTCKKQNLHIMLHVYYKNYSRPNDDDFKCDNGRL